MVVDASVWVSYFLPADRFHAATVTWLEGLLRAGEALAAPTLVLPEVAGAVARRASSADLGLEAARQVLAWPSLHLVSPDEELLLLAMQVAATLPVKGADAIYIATAQRLSVPLCTWDEEQRGRGSLVVATHIPGSNP